MLQINKDLINNWSKQMKRRKPTKAKDWLPIIEAWKKSGITKKDFCQQNNINYKTFYRWYRQLHKPELTAGLLDQPITPSFADFIPVSLNEARRKTPKAEQHCTLVFNTQLQLQIPVAVINPSFLQMLMATSGAKPC